MGHYALFNTSRKNTINSLKFYSFKELTRCGSNGLALKCNYLASFERIGKGKSWMPLYPFFFFFVTWSFHFKPRRWHLKWRPTSGRNEWWAQINDFLWSTRHTATLAPLLCEISRQDGPTEEGKYVNTSQLSEEKDQHYLGHPSLPTKSATVHVGPDHTDAFWKGPFTID